MNRLPRTSLMLIALVSTTWISAPMAETDATAEESVPSATKAVPPLPGPAVYDDTELRRFADAAVEVVRIKAAYAPLIAQKIQEQQEVSQAASEEMEEVVRQHGMSVDKYQEILTNLQADPELAGRVDKQLHESVKTKHPQKVEPRGSDGDTLKKKEQEV